MHTRLWLIEYCRHFLNGDISFGAKLSFLFISYLFSNSFHESVHTGLLDFITGVMPVNSLDQAFVSETRVNPEFHKRVCCLLAFLFVLVLFSVLIMWTVEKETVFNRFGTYACSNTGHLFILRHFFLVNLFPNETSEESWRKRNTWFWFHRW